ncbi:MAG TPA: hypothetical protein VHA79_12055 [Mycobacteriales bacterium]|jgi:hypothetical protein|nr:hypothetical protein [Mycobacteriales bacterium]
MRLKIDVRGVQFFCTRAPEPRTDRDSGAPRIDRETGQPLWSVQLAALDATGGEVLSVTVAGQPGVNVGSPVEVADLVAIPWSQGDRSGVAYRASSLRATGTPIAGVITPPPAEGEPPATQPSKRTG